MYIAEWRSVLSTCNYPCYRKSELVQKEKEKNSEEERVKSDYEKLVEGSSVKKGMFAVYQKRTIIILRLHHC